MKRICATLVPVVLVFAACGGSQSSDTTEPPVSTTAATFEFEEIRIQVGTGVKNILVFVPSNLDPAVPAPLVLNFHGAYERPDHQRIRHFHETAETEGIVVAYPQARSANALWDYEGRSDIVLVTSIIDGLSAEFAIDQNRVYAIGHSMGGGFSTFLACQLPDRITAVASVAMLHHHDPPNCETPNSARVLSILGDNDTIYSIEKGIQEPLPGQKDIPESLASETAAWAATNGCDLEPTETSLEKGAVRREYDCEGGAALVVYIHTGGHTWPEDQYGLNANTIIWEFLDQYTAPLPTR